MSPNNNPTERHSRSGALSPCFHANVILPDDEKGRVAYIAVAAATSTTEIALGLNGVRAVSRRPNAVLRRHVIPIERKRAPAYPRFALVLPRS